MNFQASLTISLVLVAVVISQSFYNDTLVRSRIFPFAAAAYGDSPQKCFDNLWKDEIGQHFTPGIISVPCMNNTHCFAYLSIHTVLKQIVIAFRGTDTKGQLWDEYRDEQDMAMVSDSYFYGKVNYYFADSFHRLWDGGLGEKLEQYYTQQGYEILFTGHSLGGALATLNVAYIVRSGLGYDLKRIKLVTFGEPRVGDATFADTLSKYAPYVLRITHYRDLIARRPCKSDGYQHHSTEIFFPQEDMGVNNPYITCIGPEDPTCSAGISSTLTNIGIEDHTHYYDVDVSVYGESNCTDKGLHRSKKGSRIPQRWLWGLLCDDDIPKHIA
ncbi:unnamed protein product, partial [Mesorhabditis belari]|uniref:Fungal lipase-type domain-containing protein n=1 Tax=Mesorhabditis belari TaxID=2138241 RepID=A0AAF3FHL8_9BILA